MNIIFLDIDGVLHTDASYLKYNQMINIGSVRLINKIATDYNCKIVLSSTWRLNCDAIEINSYLALMGFSAGLLHTDFKTRDALPEHRGELIQEWLNNHKEVEKYLIIDDDDDMLDSQKENFIHVDSVEGFSVRDYYRCESILKGYRTNQCNPHINKGYI